MDEYTNEHLGRLLLENQRLLEENNKMLKAMRRDTLISRLLRLGLIIVWIVASWYVYANFIKPSLDTLGSNQGFFEQIKENTETIKALYGGTDSTAN